MATADRRWGGGHAPFALTWAAAVGERTRRVAIGTSVTTPTFRYNPAIIAQAVATLGCLYPRRVWLGVGTGEALNEIAAGGARAWPAFDERLARLREALRLIRALWSGDPVTFVGKYYTAEDAVIADLPAERVPVLVAAGAPRPHASRERRRRPHLHVGKGARPVRRSEGDFVKKPMQDCTGEEITQEWLYHLGVPVDEIPELAATGAKSVPVMMPYVTSFFMPRQAGDRPQVAPAGSVNFAFTGQFAETTRDCIFTTEYSVRTAMEATRQLLDIERGVPEVFNSTYDVRATS